MSRTKTVAWDDVHEELGAERGLNRHGDEEMVMVAPHGPSHRPSAKATICVIENDHESLQAKK